MIISVKIKDINYGDIAVKAMPIMGDIARYSSGTAAKLIQAVSQLPEELVRGIFDAVPPVQKNEIVSTLVEENKEKLVGTLNQLSSKYSVGIMLSNLSVGQNLDVEAEIVNVDYLAIAERFLPMIKEKLLSMGAIAVLMRPVIERASASQICDMLDRILGERKEEMIVSMVNKNQNVLISAIEDVAEKQDIHLKISTIDLQS